MTAQIQPIGRRRHPGGGGIRLRRPPARVLYGLIGFVIVLPIWELVVQVGLVRKVTLSAPSIIVTTAFNDLFINRILWGNLWVSTQEYVLGFAAALVTGVPLGLALGINRRLNYLLDPWLSAIYATPTIALTPLIIIAFGIGLQSKMVIVWLEAIFVIVVSTMAGVHAVERRYLDTARSFRASRWQLFKSVTVPASVPFILTGVRLGSTRALVGVVVAEFLASNSGIGFYINFAGTSFRTDRVMLGVLILGLFGVGIGEFLRRIERRFEKWRPSVGG
jgi:NitT/TauT family transport system permease protein